MEQPPPQLGPNTASACEGLPLADQYILVDPAGAGCQFGNVATTFDRGQVPLPPDAGAPSCPASGDAGSCIDPGDLIPFCNNGS